MSAFEERERAAIIFTLCMGGILLIVAMAVGVALEIVPTEWSPFWTR